MHIIQMVGLSKGSFAKTGACTYSMLTASRPMGLSKQAVSMCGMPGLIVRVACRQWLSSLATV